MSEELDRFVTRIAEVGAGIDALADERDALLRERDGLRAEVEELKARIDDALRYIEQWEIDLWNPDRMAGRLQQLLRP